MANRNTFMTNDLDIFRVPFKRQILQLFSSGDTKASPTSAARTGETLVLLTDLQTKHSGCSTRRGAHTSFITMSIRSLKNIMANLHVSTYSPKTEISLVRDKSTADKIPRFIKG